MGVRVRRVLNSSPFNGTQWARPAPAPTSFSLRGVHYRTLPLIASCRNQAGQAGGSGCCGGSTDAEEADPAETSCCASAELKPASCCCGGSAGAEEDEGLHEGLADLLRRYNVNDYAASVKVYAVK